MMVVAVLAAPSSAVALVAVACTPRADRPLEGRDGQVRLALQSTADVAKYVASCLSPNVWPEITITGKVTRRDADVLTEVAEYLARTAPHPRSVELVLDSSGGSIMQAMRIGRAFAPLETVKVNVPKGAHCTGACTFIFAAGQYRFAQGQIGVQRPTAQDLSGMAGDAHEAMKVYLTGNGVTPKFLNIMQTIPSGMTHHLHRRTLKELGLGFQNTANREREHRFIGESCGQDYLNGHVMWERVANEQCYGQRGAFVGACIRMLDRSMQQLFGWTRRQECHYR